MDITLPNLGDGVDSATVVSVLVKPGDDVEVEQTLVELETDKAVAPIPSRQSGKIDKIFVKEGDIVKTGTIIVSLEGSGNKSQVTPPSAPQPKQNIEKEIVPPTQVSQSTVSATSPIIRQTAEILGLDLSRIPATGPRNRLTIDDIRSYIANLQQGTGSSASPGQGSVKVEKPSLDYSKWGKISKEPLSSLRKKIGEKMADTWRTIPHVTQFLDADITKVMDLRKKHVAKFEKKGAKLTLTSFAIKIVAKTLKEFPNFNASLDEANSEMVLKKYIHIGVAVDTPAGLIVPVIRDADKKSLLDISLEIAEVAKKARDRKLSLEELQGGCFTISNLGGFGVGAFTPIINAPEVAILGMGRGKKVDLGKNGSSIELPLALSYDHRVIDGADGARFIKTLAENFESFSEKDV